MPRTLTIRVGTLTLMVPQDRDSTFSTRLFARYQWTAKVLVLALMEMYVVGVSTRKVARVADAWRTTHPKIAETIDAFLPLRDGLGIAALMSVYDEAYHVGGVVSPLPGFVDDIGPRLCNPTSSANWPPWASRSSQDPDSTSRPLSST